MSKKTVITCEIYRQKAQPILTEVCLNGSEMNCGSVTLSVSEKSSGGCRTGRIRLSIQNEELDVCRNLEAEAPVKLRLPVTEQPEKITALYLFSPWWTRPAFTQRLSELPDKTQTALFCFGGRYGCFMPAVGARCKAYLTGESDHELTLVLTALHGGLNALDEPLYWYAEAPTISEAVSLAFAEAARDKNILPRRERRLPEMFRYLGWCSWNAFYTDVNEQGIREKAAELAAKHVPVKWMIIDDGWLSLQNRLLYAYEPDKEKFPEGFGRMTAELRETAGIKWFGVWHALMGYWSGVAPGSPVAVQEAPHLCRTAGGRLVPDPVCGTGFYRDWYKVLTAQGVSFVKVDGQGTVPLCFENTVPLGEAADGLHGCLESAASRMDGAVINCMGMPMENILSRPSTAVSRNSDDFFPDLEDSFREHLLQNAYNALYHNALYVCDWDMFWTQHADSAKHALLRAISGGPVYCSDRVGETDAAVLKPLVYPDGELLMMSRSAMPTQDCVFTDPFQSGFLKLQNIAPYGEGLTGGGIAVCNLTGQPVSCTFTPAEVEGITPCERYLLYDFFAQTARFIGQNEAVHCTVAANGCSWYVLLPVTGACTCLGLTEKYIGFTAAESLHDSAEAQTVVLHASGTLAWASETAPKRITVNGENVTAAAERKGILTVVPLTEKSGQTVAVLTW